MIRPNPKLVTSAALPYLVSQPAPADFGVEPWPVLCFLHGYDEGPPTPIKQALTRHGPLKPTSSSVAVSEFIVVAPQMDVSGDFWSKHSAAVHSIVEEVQRDCQGDARRTFLTGFSFGGNGVFDLALEQAGFWRALWPVDPTRVPEANPPTPIWLSSGAVSRRAEKQFIERLRLQRLKPEQADKIQPGDRIYFDEMQDHAGTASFAYRDDRIYRWLLARPRNSDYSDLS